MSLLQELVLKIHVVTDFFEEKSWSGYARDIRHEVSSRYARRRHQVSDRSPNNVDCGAKFFLWSSLAFLITAPESDRASPV